MSKLLILFNHRLTDNQCLDATDLLGVRKFVYPSEEINALWRAVPPGVADLRPVLAPVFTWMGRQGTAGDFILVQGDFGATYLVVDHALKNGMIPVYSTTERRAGEQVLEDGTVSTVHEFRHVRFREYGR